MSNFSITTTDLPRITRLLQIFDRITTSGCGERIRAVMTISLPMFGECDISYLSDESDCAVFNASGDRILSGMKILIMPDMTTATFKREVLNKVATLVTDAFADYVD